MDKVTIEKKIMPLLRGLFSGLFLGLALLEIGIRLTGFIFLSLQEQKNSSSFYKGGVYRILCLGDCMTGLGGKNSYPNQLEEILNKGNTGVKFSVINKGVPEAGFSYILAQLEDNLNRYNPQMVIIMMWADEEAQGSEAFSTKWYERLRIYNLVRNIRFGLGGKITGNEQLTREAQGKFKTAIGLDPGGGVAYINLGLFYEREGKFRQAEEQFKKAIKLNPKDDYAHISLGRCYKKEGVFKQAEGLFNRAIAINPLSMFGYLELIRFYREQKLYTQSEEVFKRASAKNLGSYFLGEYYRGEGDYVRAEKIFKDVIKKSPGAYSAYISLGQCYKKEGEYSKAEELFKKAIELTPLSDLAYIELGWLYRDRGDFIQAEEVFKKALELIPPAQNLKIYQALASLYKEMNKYEVAEEYRKKAEQSKYEGLSPSTGAYYIKIKEILDQKGIKLICVGYSSTSIEPIKRLFEGQIGVTFVDNEKIFQEALKKGSYREYFIDLQGGVFGHCTPKGNRLIAGNIANTILKGFFNE